MDKQLGSRLPDAKTLTSASLSDVMVKSGDIFSIKGYENGSPSTAEHARVDYIEFIPMGVSSDPMDEMMKPMGMEPSMMAMTNGGELAMAA